MKIYKAIGGALDKLYENQSTLGDDAVWKAIQLLKEKYGKLDHSTKIDYSAVATQYAYLFKYAGSRACAVFSIFSKSQTLRRLFDAPQLTVTSLGGGPGSDLVGLLRYWHESDGAPALNLNLIDLNDTWKTSATLFVDSAAEQLVWNPVKSRIFFPIDLNEADFDGDTKILTTAQLCSVSYVISELGQGSRTAFLDRLISRLPVGAVLLIIDNNTNEIFNLLESYKDNPDLERVTIRRDPELRLDGEDVKDMGEHFTRFGDYAKGGYPNVILSAVWMGAIKK